MTAQVLSTIGGRGALFSPCARYRYHLWRSWGDIGHRCVFVGLNPSTADATKDDPTVRKCVGFAKRWGFGALDLVNLFALRSTSPKGLYELGLDPVGLENDETLERVFKNAHRIVWAWGQHNARVRKLVSTRLGAWCAVQERCEVGTLGRAKDGSPRHPLMLAYTSKFESTP
jgi:hypothetical protein